MKAILPFDLDFDKHIRDFPPNDFGFKKFNRDHGLYILSQIILVPAQNKDIADRMKNGEAPLYSTFLRKVVTDYNRYLEYFLVTGMIVSDRKFRPKIFFGKDASSRCYAFSGDYSSHRVQTIDFSKKFSVNQKRKQNKEFKALNRKYRHLIRWLWPECHLIIDEQAAQDFLTMRFEAQKANPLLRDKYSDPVTGRTKEKDPLIQYRHAKANVYNLLGNDIRCTVDATVGRMHTVLTNMKSDLRHFITLNGERLVSIDITNSQPYLSTSLFNREIYETKGRDKQNRLKIKKINPQIQEEINNNPLMLLNIEELFDSEDFKLFSLLVSEDTDAKRADYVGKDIYTYMCEAQFERTGISQVSRAEMKVGMFEVLFSKNAYRPNSGAKKIFSELFPSVSQFFIQLKKTNHALLPILLQSIEAHIILNLISKKIAKLHPKAPLFTIHDSITTTEAYSSIVREIMKNELTSIIGLSPKLKTELWHPDQLDLSKYTHSK